VTDLAAAHIDALEHLEREDRSEAFNLGSGAGCSVLEVARQVAETTGRPVPLAVCPRRSGDPPVLVADATRAEARLGWRARHSSLREIVESAWRFHRAQA
jgi:UDP-glucose 4-epimerase